MRLLIVKNQIKYNQIQDYGLIYRYFSWYVENSDVEIYGYVSWQKNYKVTQISLFQDKVSSTETIYISNKYYCYPIYNRWRKIIFLVKKIQRHFNISLMTFYWHVIVN